MKRTLAFVCLALLVGCDEDIKKAQDLNLSKPLQLKVFKFSTVIAEGGSAEGESKPIGMPTADEAYCFLTRVAGDFQGSGEFVLLDDASSKWALTGAAQSPGGVAASATCVPKFSFQMKSDKLSSLVAETLPPPGGAWNDNCAVQQTAFFATGRASFLSGIKGRWTGKGEGLAVTSNPSGSENGKLHVQGCDEGSGGWGMNYVLRPDLEAVRYWTPSGPTTNSEAATFSTSAALDAPQPWFWFQTLETGGTGSAPVVLAPVNEAVCGIVAIGGGFRGGGESVEITPNGDNWELRVTNQQKPGFVAGAARCILRDQRG
ncbi:MAG: hypothetical protein QOH06_4802 [Acidobacteriota bacterium]|jgi:hypothetical protein|nr:hypothetical protein [Acidobacteriota bacterium]